MLNNLPMFMDPLSIKGNSNPGLFDPNGETYIWGFFFFASEIYHYINSMF